MPYNDVKNKIKTLFQNDLKSALGRELNYNVLLTDGLTFVINFMYSILVL